MNITDKRIELLEICDKQGYFLLEDGLETYKHIESVSRAVSDLCEYNLLVEKKAPEISKKKKVWDITEKGKVFTSK